MPKYSTGLLNEFAPHIAELTKCNLPPMEEQKNISRSLINSFILNSAFFAKYPEPMHQYGISFLRKTEAAFQEYYYALELLSIYVNTHILYNDKPNEKLSQYFEILHRFEVLISQIYQAYMVFEKFLNLEKHGRFWKKGDGSSLEKISVLYNFSKHAEDKIKETPSLPGYHIWLTNSGVSCEQEAISFFEISELLQELAENASYYSNVKNVIDDIQSGAYDERINER